MNLSRCVKEHGFWGKWSIEWKGRVEDLIGMGILERGQMGKNLYDTLRSLDYVYIMR